MAFMVLAVSQLVHAFNMRTTRPLSTIGMFSNHKLNWAVLASLALTCFVLFTPAHIAFGLMILPVKMYVVAIGLVLMPLVVMELSKTIKIMVRR